MSGSSIIWYKMMNLVLICWWVFLSNLIFFCMNINWQCSLKRLSFFRWIFNLYANVYSVDSSTSNIPKKFILIKFWIFSRRTAWFIACKHLGWFLTGQIRHICWLSINLSPRETLPKYHNARNVNLNMKVNNPIFHVLINIETFKEFSRKESINLSHPIDSVTHSLSRNAITNSLWI